MSKLTSCVVSRIEQELGHFLTSHRGIHILHIDKTRNQYKEVVLLFHLGQFLEEEAYTSLTVVGYRGVAIQVVKLPGYLLPGSLIQL